MKDLEVMSKNGYCEVHRCQVMSIASICNCSDSPLRLALLASMTPRMQTILDLCLAGF